MESWNSLTRLEHFSSLQIRFTLVAFVWAAAALPSVNERRGRRSALLRSRVSVTMAIRSRSCWTGAGRCSGSRWPPAGSASPSTCGPSWLPWSAPSALRPESPPPKLESGSSDSRGVARRTLSQGTTPPTLGQGTTPPPQTQPSPQCSTWRIICCLLFYMLVFYFVLQR